MPPAWLPNRHSSCWEAARAGALRWNKAPALAGSAGEWPEAHTDKRAHMKGRVVRMRELWLTGLAGERKNPLRPHSSSLHSRGARGIPTSCLEQQEQPKLAKPRDSLILLPGSAPRGASSGYPGITHGKILCAEFLIQEEVIREGNNLSWHTEHSRVLLLGRHQEQN